MNGSVMVDAMMIDVNGNIEAGVHNLELDASGALDFSADVVRLSARMLTLEAGFIVCIVCDEFIYCGDGRFVVIDLIDSERHFRD